MIDADEGLFTHRIEAVKRDSELSDSFSRDTPGRTVTPITPITPPDGLVCLRGFSGLNAFTLKIIAISSMLIDHTGAMLYPDIIWFRIIGRLAYPLFAFLICEGFRHTRNVKRYALRLALFAAISEIPFNLLHSYRLFDIEAQNVFFTLLIGLLTLYGMDRLGDGSAAEKKGAAADKFAAAGRGSAASCRGSAAGYVSFQPLNYKQLLVFIAGLATAQLLRSDYGVLGIIIIFIFDRLRGKRALTFIFLGAVNLLVAGPVQALSCAAVAPIFMYNGKKGPSMKYLFYIFYPAHIIALTAVKYFAFRIPFE